MVDSLFATSDVDIDIADINDGNVWKIRKIEEVEDFDDRNVIKIYKVGDYDRNWSSAKDDYKEYFINKCAFKHEMLWAMSKVNLDFVKIAKSYPVKLQMLAITAKRDDHYIFDSWLDDLCSNIIYNENKNEMEQDMLNYIETFKSRNILWSFLAAVMVQVNSYSSYFSPEFKMKLFNATKEIVNQVPSLKNNEALPVIISSNGKVTTKENCKNIYEPIMNFILAEYNKNKDK